MHDFTLSRFDGDFEFCGLVTEYLEAARESLVGVAPQANHYVGVTQRRRLAKSYVPGKCSKCIELAVSGGNDLTLCIRDRVLIFLSCQHGKALFGCLPEKASDLDLLAWTINSPIREHEPRPLRFLQVVDGLFNYDVRSRLQALIREVITRVRHQQQP